VRSSVISIYEFADDITEDYLNALTLPYRLTQMRAIVSMIASLNETIVGPFTIGAFKFRHIAVRNGNWALIDIGGFHSGDILCGENLGRINTMRYIGRRETIQVKSGEICPGNRFCVKGHCKNPYKETIRDRLCNYVWMYLVNNDNVKAMCRNMSTNKYMDYLESTIRL